MAELFLAKQVGMEGFEKVVALKRILAHLAYDEDFINMFRDEARIVAKLSHPNIVQIYDLGKSDDSYFIAMEYIPGRNLSSIAKKAKGHGETMPSANVARCMAQACEGLHYAHTRQDLDGAPLGIVHRDVSPQNIIVAFSGGVKLVDFGIAKAATKIQQTRAGVLKGKYAYMSPEQIRGERIDARSDLFSVGIVLYELLAGRRPFEKDNSIQTLKAIVQDRHVDVRNYNAEVPEPFVKIIDRCLQKKVADRYQSAQEVQVDLEDFCSSSRVNNVVISDWLKRLFADELARDKGSTVVFKDVGAIILPDIDSDPSASSASGAAPPSYETGRASIPSDGVDVDVDDDVRLGSASVASDVAELPRGRGGGSVEGPRRSTSRSDPGRPELLEEGTIDREQQDDPGAYDDNETALAEAASDRETKLGAKPAPRSGGSAAVVPRQDSNEREPTLDAFGSESTVEAYDEDELPAAVNVEKVPMYDDSQTEFANPPPGPSHEDDTAGIRIVDPSDRARPAPKARAATPATPEPELELSNPELPSEGQDEDPWGDRTSHDDPDAAAAEVAEPVLGEFADTLGADSSPDWRDRTSADQAPDLGALRAKLLVHDEDEADEADELWGEKTTGAVDPNEPNEDFEAALGAEVDDEITGSGRLSGVREQTDAQPERRFGASPAPTEYDDDDALAGRDDDEDALPSGIDLSRNVDADSSTIAGTTSDFVGAGLAVPSMGAYEPKVDPEPPQPVRPSTLLGGIKLQKVAAAPRGGVKESRSAVDHPAHEEVKKEKVKARPVSEPPDADFGESPTVGGDPDDLDELPLPSSPARKPAFGADEPTEFSGADSDGRPGGLLAPKVPPAMVPAKHSQGPMGIGSTHVPPANVSLSEMLVDPGAKQGYGSGYEKKSASAIRGTPMTGVRGSSLSVEAPIVAPEPEPVKTNVPQRSQKPIVVRQIREANRGGHREETQAQATESAPPQPVLTPMSSAPFAGPPFVPDLAPLPPVGGHRRNNVLPIVAGALLVLAVVAVAAVVMIKLRSKPALLIESDPPGATVTVDDSPFPGKTPVELSAVVENQQYKVRVEFPGYVPQTKLVRIPAGSGRSHVKFGLEKSSVPTPPPPPVTPPPSDSPPASPPAGAPPGAQPSRAPPAQAPPAPAPPAPPA
ncbi:MAG: protein kinase [Deltaproteobacteria bacterium]|nr:protein kinase [Deltaproteobacteria bacterium]